MSLKFMCSNYLYSSPDSPFGGYMQSQIYQNATGQAPSAQYYWPQAGDGKLNNIYIRISFTCTVLEPDEPSHIRLFGVKLVLNQFHMLISFFH